MKKSLVFALLITIPFLGTLSLAASAPTIKHSPAKAGIQGQPILIRATVQDESGKLTAVNLHCSVSSDTAPFKVKMASSGGGFYMGSIPASLTANAPEVKYYIEAINEMGETTETPWHTVALEVKAPAVPHTALAPITPSSSSNNKKSSSYKTPLLIGGGVALAAGGAALALNLSDDKDSSSSSITVTNEGSYAGTASRYTTVEGSSSSSMSYLTTLVVLSSGRITSDDLHPETHMEASLAGSDFVMSAPISGDITGEIRYSGSVGTGRITGSILGSGTTSSGTNVSFSGIFSALKQ